MKNEAARLRAGADALSAAKDVVFAALAAVEAEEVAQAEKKAADSEEAAVGSALTASLRKTSNSTTSAWSATGTPRSLGPTSGCFLRLMWRSLRRSLQSFRHRNEL